MIDRVIYLALFVLLAYGAEPIHKVYLMLQKKRS